MKKIFTLVAGLLLAMNSFAVTEFTGFDLKGQSQTFSQYGGDFKDTQGQDFDASSYDYVWLKYSGLTGTCNFIITYNDWKATQSWGETFQDAAVTLTAESGIVAIKLDKKSIIQNGNAKENGQFKGDTYAQHVRQLAVQATSADGATVTIEGVYFGTADEYKAAAGISEKNHVLKVTAATTPKNHWDYQIGVNTNLPFGGTYTLTGKVKATTDAKFDVWTDDGVAYPNTKTQYGNAQIVATTDWQDFSIQLAPGTVDGNDFDIKHISIVTDFAGDAFFDDITISDANGNVITSADFELDMGGLTVNGMSSALVEDEVTAGINHATATKVNAGKIFNIQGQEVGENYRGVVIVNGKKMIKK